MEANLKLIFLVSVILSTIPHVTFSVGNERETDCPDSVKQLCLAEGREPCSGREHVCGECITGYKVVNGKCTNPTEGNEELPEVAVDQLAERLAEKKSGENKDTSSQENYEPNPKNPPADPPQVERKTLEANAAVETQESHPKPFTGEIVLEEWQFMLIVGGCILLAVIGVAIAFYCCYRIQTASKDAEAEYPSYGVTGPGAAMSGDRKLAQSAQMYHYQHQKQQMIAMQKREKGESAEDASDYDSEEENEEGDLTVYECPGLAPTGEMQVKNPLFSEEQYKEATPPPAEEKP